MVLVNIKKKMNNIDAVTIINNIILTMTAYYKSGKKTLYFKMLFV